MKEPQLRPQRLHARLEVASAWPSRRCGWADGTSTAIVAASRWSAQLLAKIRAAAFGTLGLFPAADERFERMTALAANVLINRHRFHHVFLIYFYFTRACGYRQDILAEVLPEKQNDLP